MLVFNTAEILIEMNVFVNVIFPDEMRKRREFYKEEIENGQYTCI